jgi:hypothetical protein
MFAAFLLCLCGRGYGRAEPSDGQVETTRSDDVLIGVAYFPGWWEAMPSKWHSRSGEDWQPKFPERIPLLGQYNCAETMNREIVAAAEHAVDFSNHPPFEVERDEDWERCISFVRSFMPRTFLSAAFL